MTLLGQDPVICKIIVDDKCLQQVRNFKCLGCEISHGNGKDSQQKLKKKFCSIIGDSKQQF
jgi:hypothetical protein